jgi:hypothetical protein
MYTNPGKRNANTALLLLDGQDVGALLAVGCAVQSLLLLLLERKGKRNGKRKGNCKSNTVELNMDRVEFDKWREASSLPSLSVLLSLSRLSFLSSSSIPSQQSYRSEEAEKMAWMKRKREEGKFWMISKPIFTSFFLLALFLHRLRCVIACSEIPSLHFSLFLSLFYFILFCFTCA